MDYVISALLGIILTIIRIIFYDSFLARKKSILPVWIVVILFAALSVGNTYLFNSWPWIKQIVSVFLGILIAVVAYDATILRSVLVSVLFLAIASLIDVISSYALLAISNATLNELRANMSTFLVGAGVSHVVLLAVAIILKRIRSNNNSNSPLTYKVILQLLLFPIISAFVLVAMFNDMANDHNTSPLAFVSVIGLLTANLALVFIFDKLEQEYQVREENQLLHQQIRLETNNITSLMAYHEAHVCIAHDHANHLKTLRTLLANGASVEAQTYLDGLIEKREDTQYTIFTNNPVADAILNLKYLLAKRNKIRVVVDVNNLAQFPLKSEELATVLTNVLDNAIEGCSNVKERPEIRLKIHYDPHESLISVRNTTAYPVIIKDNKVKSTKTNEELHGFGLKNVEAVLLKNGYDYAIDCSDGWFQFTAVL